MAQIELDTDNRQSLWLLIGGPSKLPKELSKTATDKARKKDDGSYKNGITKDIKMMKKRIAESDDFTLFKSLKNMEKLKKKTVLKNITAVIKQAWQKDDPVPAIIYYTGKAIKDKGDWCFVDATLTIDEFLEAIPPPPQKGGDDDQKGMSDEDALKDLMEKSSYAVYIICDCSFAGRWRIKLKKVESKVDIFFYGACDGKKKKLAQDTKEGGKFTRFLLSGNQMLGAPEPVALEVCDSCLFDSGNILWSDQIVNQLKKNAYK
eukprot:CAMPEP_0201583360 /NCGR_PEP_ID=MMETSP0190_2-20130828/97628_1 /ASSEMBLY_ACC=CAM_ASM_000263 /TAXON_ID=37353 /ORGANISM="Rosalina sp." /LENGTH=261 /DNA_ID=CAMNT_0048025099 /DNA_START=35 /DNA_END=817 /DNA_ORIENTATION=+